MSTIVGTWELALRTPIGTLAVVYTFIDAGGVLAGTATSRSETVELTDIAATPTPDGQHVTWRQSVTRPMRLHLEFDVTTAGDTLTGHSRAGRLPRTAVTGTRRAG